VDIHTGDGTSQLLNMLVDRVASADCCCGHRFDTDIIFGDISTPIRQHVKSADVITFPDGVLGALYLGGQLTLFRNNAFFRACFVAGYDFLHNIAAQVLSRVLDSNSIPTFARTKLPGQYLCQKGNRLSDEKFSLYHALRSKRSRIVFDLSNQFSGTGRGHHSGIGSYEWVLGHVFRPGTASAGYDKAHQGLLLG